MNIFLLDSNHQVNAIYHADRHVTKMILESTQMLSTAVRMSGIDAGYRKTHAGHPCTKWAFESLSNWLWLKELVLALNSEWQYRYNHTRLHKSCEVALNLPVPSIQDIGLTPFALAMPYEYKTNNPVMSYREYYKNCKQHLFSWTKRETPFWVK